MSKITSSLKEGQVVTIQCYAVKNSQVLKVNINVIPSNTQL